MNENQSIALKEAALNKSVGKRSVLENLGRGGFALLLSILLIVAYILSLSSPPLLDEQFLMNWLKELPRLQGSFGFSGFMFWPGFAPADTLGVTSKFILLFFGMIFGKSIFFYKFTMLILHGVSTYLVYLCSRRITPERFTSIVAALLFAFYPLHYEAVTWLGGFGSELGTLFFLAAFHLHLLDRSKSVRWVRLGLVGLLMFFAISSSAMLWPSCLAFALYELCNLAMPQSQKEETELEKEEPQRKKDLSMSLISILIPVLPVGLYLAASGVINAALMPNFRVDNLLACFKHLFMPINELNWQKYSRAYIAFYAIYGFILPCFATGMFLSPALRRAAVFSLLFLALTALPLVGIAAPTGDLYGERLLYLASFPLCLFLSCGLSGLTTLKGKLKIVGTAVGGILALVLCIFFFSHLWNENAANRNRARVATTVQKSAKILAEKERIPFLIVRDLPDRMSIEPAFSPRGPVMLDTQKGLLRSNPVPDGRLKELLRENRLEGCTWRWEKDMKSFVVLDHLTRTAIMPESLNAEAISNRMEPAILFYTNVHLSPDKSEIVLESNSENGPMITLNPFELSTIDGDFLYLDAQIEAPTSFASPHVELHWQTRVHKEYEKRERFSYADAVINDQKVHRYLLSLRGNGWTTGGMATIIALGFPAGSRVHLKQMGLIKKESLLAQLKDASDPATFVDQSRNRYTPPFFNYPLSAELGLIPLSSNASSFSAEYSVAHVPDAAGVTAELSYPNRYFDDANSNHLSGQTYKTLTPNGTTGKITINCSELPGPGVYSLRVIARSAAGNYLGQFSDPICYQVPRVSKE